MRDDQAGRGEVKCEGWNGPDGSGGRGADMAST